MLRKYKQANMNIKRADMMRYLTALISDAFLILSETFYY